MNPAALARVAERMDRLGLTPGRDEAPLVAVRDGHLIKNSRDRVVMWLDAEDYEALCQEVK